MNQAFRAYFRSPDSVADFRLGGELQKESGFFRFGAGIDCYGQCSVRQPVTNYRAHLEDVSFATKIDRRHVTLPFDPNQVAENLRLEAYTGQMHAGTYLFRRQRGNSSDLLSWAAGFSSPLPANSSTNSFARRYAVTFSPLAGGSHRG